MPKLRYISLFSGIEAATVAWGPLGWEPVAFCEIDKFPSAVLAYHYPDVPNLGDITKIDWKKVKDTYGTVDLVVGGSPCQSFSVAGKREGLAGESGLMYEYIRAVQDLMPAWFVWENVPGALSSERGYAFGQLLAKMDEFGYGLAWRVLDAQFFGVPQRRRRIFLVGHFGCEPPTEVLFDSESLRWDFVSGKEKRAQLTLASQRDTRCHSFCGQASSGAGSVGYADECSPTLRSGSCGLQAPVVLEEQDTLVFDTQNITSSLNRSNPRVNDACHTLTANMEPPVCIQAAYPNRNDPIHSEQLAFTHDTNGVQDVICLGSDTSNASIDEDLCGTLHIGGGGCLL